MSAAGHSQEPLDVLIQKITNPLNQTYDPQLVYAFCERVKQQQDGPLAATRLLAYRIQSPQEREAMLALDLLDTCARTGGANFQAELGKFRFLNELIKLLSPRYLGSRTPQRVKQRAADLLLSWARQIPHETKIQEAFTLLQKQGLLDMHGITPRLPGGAASRPDDALTVPESAAADVALDPHRAPTPPLPSTERPQNPIFEDRQKAALLKRLLQSTNPEDIQAANRLIKTMVKQDEERSERVCRRVTELETVHTNLRLLQEMMDSYSPATTSTDELELMTELCSSCEQLRGKLDSLAAEADDQDSALADLVSASEQIGATLERHRSLGLASSAGDPPPLTLLQLESPQEPPPQETPPLSSQEVLQRQLERLGLSDPDPAPLAAGSTAAPPAGAPDLLGPPPAGTAAAVSSAPAGSSLADLLASLSPPPVQPASQQHQQQQHQQQQQQQHYRLMASQVAAASGPSQPAAPGPSQAAPGPSQPVASGPFQAAAPGPSQPAASGPSLPAASGPSLPAARSALDDIDDLVRLSMSSSAAPVQAQTVRLTSALSSSLSTNQGAGPSASPRPTPLPTNQTPPLSPGRVAGAEPNGRHPIADLLGDDVSLLSALSGPSSLLSESGAAGSGQGQAASGQGQDPAGGDATPRGRPPSLAEVTVTLDEIRPGGGAPLALFHEPDSLEISLHPAANRPRRDVTVCVITALNRTGRPVSQYTLQAVCDKTARVRLQAPSSSELPAGSPFLPPPAVSQVLLLAQSDPQTNIHLRFMLSYAVDDDVVTEMAEATLPGQS